MAKKCFVAVSGGVDSAVSLFLLKKAGYGVEGITMVQFGEDIAAQNPADLADAKALCDKAGVNHNIVHLETEFFDSVIKDFGDSYEKGETPNPCVVCNKYIKFGVLAEKAYSLGADIFATGHYVKTETQNGKKVISRAKCREKDQSYMLWMLSAAQIDKFIAPLGDLTKDEVRAIAEEEGLAVAHKSDSQDICFIPNGDYREFLCRIFGDTDKKGDFVHTSGALLGKHLGQRKYTLGQRKGLGVSYTEPLYVVGRDIEKNQIILGSNGDLFRDNFLIRNANFSALDAPAADLKCNVRVRYHAPDVPAVISPVGEGVYSVKTSSPVRAVTPGQSAVFYDGDVLLGGGIIQQ